MSVYTTPGTETEQLVRLALENAGVKPEEVNIIYAQPAACVAAFLRGDAQACTGGVNDQLKIQSINEESKEKAWGKNQPQNQIERPVQYY